MTTGSRVPLSQHLCLGTPLFASVAQSKQDESQETLTKSWALSFGYNPRNVVHTCKMSNYISGNQAGLLLNKSSDFPFSPKGRIWHQAFLLSCGREPVGMSVHVCACAPFSVIFRGQRFGVRCCLLSTSSYQVYISVERGLLCWRLHSV